MTFSRRDAHRLHSCDDKWINLPITNGNQDNIGYKLECVVTSESSAKEMLSINEELLSLLATFLLNVDVASESSGSESEYLPDAYRPLHIK